MIKDLLQGKWLKHPLHPVVVSIPLGLWPISLLLDLWSLFGEGNATAVAGSFYALLIGFAGALIAIPTGLADFTEIKPDKPARPLAIRHLLFNTAGSLFWLASLAMHWPARAGGVAHAPAAAIGCSMVALVLSLVAAYLGGRLVYEHGIGVGRFSKQELRRVAAEANNNVPRQEEQGA